MSDDTHIGMEVDGSRVTVVESLGGMAISAHFFSADTLEESMADALKSVSIKRNSPPIRVAVVAPGATLRRLEVSARHLEARKEFEEAVYAALPMARETSSTAGLFLDRDALVGDAVAGAVAAVAPLAIVDRVYQCLGDLNCEVVASPIALGGYDGVWLGLHEGAAEATLVENGYPVAFRQLRAGGLSAVAGVLSDGSNVEVGRARLMAAVTRTGLQDAIADAELGRYLRMVATELVQTMEFWRRNGELVPEDMNVLTYGVGASAPAVRHAFNEEGLRAVLPDALSGQMVYVSPSDREAGLLAFLASITVGDQAPQSVFTNPSADAVLARRKARKRKTIKLAVIGGTLAVVGLVFGVPFVSGLQTSNDASGRLEAAQTRAIPLQPIYHQTLDLEQRKQVVAAAVVDEPQWSDVLGSAYETLPQGATITKLTASAEGGLVTVTVEATKPNGIYEEMSGWLSRLMSDKGATQAWSNGFSITDKKASYQISFALPANSILSERAKEQAGLTEAGSEEPAPAEGSAGTTTAPVPAPSGSGAPVPEMSVAPAPETSQAPTTSGSDQ